VQGWLASALTDGRAGVDLFRGPGSANKSFDRWKVRLLDNDLRHVAASYYRNATGSAAVCKLQRVCPVGVNGGFVEDAFVITFKL